MTIARVVAIVTWWQRPRRKRKTNEMATSNYVLPPPQTLEIYDSQVAEKWKRFKRAWTNYALATELNAKPEAVQVATLLR